MASAGMCMPLLACLSANTPWLSAFLYAPATQAAAADATGPGGPTCWHAAAGAAGSMQRSRTPGARLPARASGTWKGVGENPQPLRSDRAPIGPCPLARIARGRRGPRVSGPGPILEQAKLRSGRSRLCPPRAERTQGVAPQGSAFGALARTVRWTHRHWLDPIGRAAGICNSDLPVVCLCAVPRKKKEKKGRKEKRKKKNKRGKYNRRKD